MDINDVRIYTESTHLNDHWNSERYATAKSFLNQSSQTASNQEFIWEKIVSLKRAKHRIGEKWK